MEVRINRKFGVRHEAGDTPNIYTVSSILCSDDQFLRCAASITGVLVPGGSKNISTNVVNKHNHCKMELISTLRDAKAIPCGPAEIITVHYFADVPLFGGHKSIQSSSGTT